MTKATTLSLVLGLSAQVWASSPTVKFQPQNISETTSQLKAVFSTKMVALGANPDANIFDLSCTPTLKGTAGWANETTWTFNVRSDLDGNQIPGGTRCTAKLKAGIKDAAGIAVAGLTNFQFQVDGPNILSMYPGVPSGQDTSPIIQKQVFAINLDSNVDMNSVLRSVYFKVEGIASAVQIHVLGGDELKAVIASDQFSGMLDKDKPLVVFRASQPFPSNAKVSLVWGKGVKAADSGLARQRNLMIPFKVEASLTAQMYCGRENARADCSPFSDIQVDFSAPVPKAMAEKIYLESSATHTKVYPRLGKDDSVSSVSFPASVREKQSYKLVMPAGLKDETGRKLADANKFPMTIKTSDFPPLAKFSGDFGIIESKITPVLLPATLRNLEAKVIAKEFAPAEITGASIRLTPDDFPAIVQWMRALDIKGQDSARFENRNKSIFASRKSTKKPSTFKIPLAKNGKSFEVVGIPLAGPGFYVVELQSRILGRTLLGKEANMYVPTGALVTNMVVHSKVGSSNSLFWVTALDTGKPVPQATVNVYDCTGKAVGVALTTNDDGVAKYNGNLNTKVGDCEASKARRGQGNSEYSSYNYGFFVSAQTDNDFTFTHSNWTNGIESWRFGSISSNYNLRPDNGPIAHTVLDRSLFRVGETVSMKHIMRVPTMTGFKFMAATDLPTLAYVTAEDGSQFPAIPLTWDANGTALSTFTIPRDGKVGNYTISLVKPKGDKVESSYTTTSFQVQDFTVPQLKGLISFPGADVTKLVQPSSLKTQVGVNYQEGGPDSNAAVGLSYQLTKNVVFFEAFPGMTFGAERVAERHGRQGEGQDQNVASDKVALRLDVSGGNVYQIPIANTTGIRELSTTLTFVDTSQNSQDLMRKVPIYPASQLVGIKTANDDDMVVEGKSVKVKVAVADVKGQPIQGVTPTIEVFDRMLYSSKTKMVGGFYSSENFEDVVPSSKATVTCNGPTDEFGYASCKVKVPAGGGDYIIQAEARDNSGNASYASADVYFSGKRGAYYPSANDDRMDLLTLNNKLEANDQAKFNVRMPFEDATVLVTIEREGVLDYYLQSVNRSNPVVQFKVKPSYAPNVYVSALAVRGRIGGTGKEETATIDLGKPAFKLGMAPLYVNWKEHKLGVKVKPNKDTYKPGEAASVEMTVVDPTGAPVKNADVALAVVDSGLLDLAKNQTWNLLEDMMTSRPLAVRTATAQMQVIGKRHYGMKAKPTGGDGGATATRKLFDTLVFWVGSVKTDASGRATVNFNMKDSLSAFKVVAVANSGADQFGKGEYEHDIVTKQDIEIRQSIGSTARQGDVADVQVTVRNTTDAENVVSVSGTALITYRDQDGQIKTKSVPLASQSVTLGAPGSPGNAQLVNLGHTAIENNVTNIKYNVVANNTHGGSGDSMQIEQTVKPSVDVTTWMASLARIDGTYSTNVELPATALPGQGGVSISLISSLSNGLDSVNRFFTAYPFESLEYSISRAVANGDQALWNQAMGKLPAYLDAEGLVMYYPNSGIGQGSDMLTAYILSVANYSGYVIPASAEDRMVTALTNVIQGKSRASGNSTAADSYIRRVNAIEVLSRMGKGRASWLTALPTIAPEQVPTATLINLLSIYQVLDEAPQAEQKAKKVQDAIRLRLTQAGGTALKLNPDRARPSYDMSSNKGDQLRLILVIASNPDLVTAWQIETPNLMVGAAKLMENGSWGSTYANAYGVLALKAYKTAFEKQNVTGVTQISFNNATQSAFDWSQTPQGGDLALGWPGVGTFPVSLTQSGTGTPWAIVAVNAAVPLTSKVENVIGVTKELTPAKAVYNVGDVVTVTLTVKASTGLSNVSMVDPIPSGARIIGSGLDNDGGEGPGGMIPDFQQIKADGYYGTYSSIDTQQFKISYRMQMNTPGTFKMPATRFQAIYAPENFSLVPNADITVQPVR